MRKLLKWTGIILGGLLLVALFSSWILSRKFLKESEKTYQVAVTPVTIPSDSASLERGRVLSVGCRDCHDTNLAGKVFFDDPAIGVLPSSNLTRAKGSETEGYAPGDYVRALRHGLNRAGHPLMIMPSESYTHLSDQDLGSLVAFLMTLKPVERTFPKRKFTYMAQVMAGAGLFGDLYPYHVIDHDKARNITAPPIGPTEEYGAYIFSIGGCKTCHGEHLGGGPSPDPASPVVPNVSVSGNPGKWTAAQFVQVFRTGTTPEGKQLDGKFMPFPGIGALQDAEIEALYHYIRSLPPAPERK
ncbi:MAG TPA: cytochrome c [Flavilitoribacter sp.]|nr:cytochrome c [Flavilitoribacter sp.]